MKSNTKNTKEKIGVIGGDRRQLAAAEELAGDGFEVALCGFDRYEGDLRLPTRCACPESAVRDACAVILPVPYSSDGAGLNCPYAERTLRTEDLFGMLSPDRTVFGGKFDPGARELAQKRGVRLYDLCEDDAFNIANALPTAEGAVAIAMERMPVTVAGSRCTVVGFGKIGKILSRMLLTLGAEVTVTARKEADLAWIRATGCRAVHTDRLACAVRADAIFNTVPAMLLTRQVLEKAKRGTLIVDLASGEGGVDRRAAQELGIDAVHALSLPGKTSPVTAGRAIASCVKTALRKEGGTSVWKP